MLRSVASPRSAAAPPLHLTLGGRGSAGARSHGAGDPYWAFTDLLPERSREPSVLAARPARALALLMTAWPLTSTWWMPAGLPAQPGLVRAIFGE
jgi:hypothetical protein